MSHRRHRARARWLGARSAALLLLPWLLAGGSGAARAQFQGGHLYGNVLDEEGKLLPGVAVRLSGASSKSEQKSDEQGRLRFVGLDPGNYELQAELSGFAPVVYKSVEILVGRSTSVQIRMSKLPGETIVVTSEPPLLEEVPRPQGIRVTSFELDVIPTTRDPWAVVAQAPGVLMDGVNAGGNKSNVQMAFVGPGSSRAQNAFVFDGVTVTDMAAGGASPLYYDFDQLEEVRVTVGGPNAAAASAGVVVDLVTKRGGNEWRGSARYFDTDGSWQARPRVGAIAAPAPVQFEGPGDLPPRFDRVQPNRIEAYSAAVSQIGGQTAAAPAPAGPPASDTVQERLPVGRIQGIEDYGLEAGGLLYPERLWAWGSFGVADIRQLALGGDLDRTELANWAGKLNAQLGPSSSAGFTYHRAEKTRTGLGAGPTRSPETLQRQAGPVEILKLEGSQVLGTGFHMTGMYSTVDAGFAIDPAAGPGAEVVLDPQGIWRGSFAASRSQRDSRHAQLDASAFADGWPGSHELRFGGNHREFRSSASEVWGPRDLIQISGENAGTEYDIVRALRPGQVAARQEYTSLWAQDNLRADNLTLTLGLRYDRQEGRSERATLGANPAFPELLPATAYAGRGPDFRWESLTPRIGASYTVGPEARTILRAGYSRFVAQLNTTLVDRLNPLADASATLGFRDLDGDSIFDPGEEHFLLSTQGIDPSDPTALASPHVTDPGLDPEITDELTLGIEKLARPDFVVGLQLTRRLVTGVLESRRLVRDAAGEVRPATAADYRKERMLTGFLPNGNRYQEPVYTLDPALSYTGGRLLLNGDREQDYRGLTLTATKRLAERWMLRGNFTFSDWRWRIGPEFRRHDDPSDLAPDPAQEEFGEGSDGDNEVVAEQSWSVGEREGLFLNSGWSFNLNGLYQVAPARPWGFNVAANLSGREGYPIHYAIRTTPADGLSRSLQVTDRADSYRYQDVYTLDLRLEKEWSFADLSGTVSFDCFNLLNAGTVLQRARYLNAPQANFIRETVGPRVFRLGTRLRWR